MCSRSSFLVQALPYLPRALYDLASDYLTFSDKVLRSHLFCGTVTFSYFTIVIF